MELRDSKIDFHFFLETVKDRVIKFSLMIDVSIGVCDWGLNKLAVTSGRHRK
jgi:hypothetical protein